MAELTARAVRVYAVLEAYRSGEGDILDTLVPFLEPFLNDRNGTILDPAALSAQVKSAYGWNVTPDVIEEFIPRFQTKGWLQESGAPDTRAYRITYKPQNDPALAESELKIASVLADLGDQFKTFVDGLSPLTAHNRTPHQLSDALIEWLISIDGYTERALQIEIKKISNVAGKLTYSVELPEGDPLDSEDRYLCARFTKHLFETKSPAFQALTRIASIGLLTEVVQDFCKPTGSVTKTDLTVYLDAPVALDYLGVSGGAAQQNIDPLLKELRRIGATIRIFRTSVEELHRALVAVLKRQPFERTGPTADAMRRGELAEAYARAVRDDADHYLQLLDVQIDERRLDQFPNSHPYFPQAAYDYFFKTIQWHLDAKPREHDATTTALIVRMRSGTFTKDIFKSRFVLITRNAQFALAARDVARKHADLPYQALGPVVHQRALATAMWLRTGLNTTELPRRYLLATCERVLGLKPNVIEQARITASKITPETTRQLELLLTEPRSARFLMDKTLGASQVITSGNIELLVEGMQKTLIAEHEAKSRVALTEERRKARGTLQKKEDELAAAHAVEQTLRSDLEIHRQATRKIIERAVDDANREIRFHRNVIRAAVACIAAVLVIGPQFSGSMPDWAYWICIAIGIGLGGPLAYLQLWDQPIGMKNAVEHWYRRTLAKTLSQRGIAQTADELGIKFADARFGLPWAEKLSSL